MAKGREKPDREERRQKKRWDLQDRSPECVVCGESDERCLERHHIAGKKHHDDLVILCRNCHRKISDEQLDHFPFSGPEPRNDLATMGFYLLGTCEVHAKQLERLRQFGAALIELSEREDE